MGYIEGIALQPRFFVTVPAIVDAVERNAQAPVFPMTGHTGTPGAAHRALSGKRGSLKRNTG